MSNTVENTGMFLSDKTILLVYPFHMQLKSWVNLWNFSSCSATNTVHNICILKLISNLGLFCGNQRCTEPSVFKQLLQPCIVNGPTDLVIMVAHDWRLFVSFFVAKNEEFPPIGSGAFDPIWTVMEEVVTRFQILWHILQLEKWNSFKEDNVNVITNSNCNRNCKT